MLTKSSKLRACLAELNEDESVLVQVVGGRGSEVGVGGSKHFGPAKFKGLEEAGDFGVTDLLLLFITLMGSDAHLCVIMMSAFTLLGVLKPSWVEVGDLLEPLGGLLGCCCLECWL